MEDKTKRDLTRIADAASEEAFRQVCQEFPLIIAKFTEQAVGGSVPHAKFLLDWSGLLSPTSKLKAETEKAEKIEKPEKPPVNLEPEFSLAQLLLDTLAAFDRGELKST